MQANRTNSIMSRSEFVERANHGQHLTVGYHWNPAYRPNAWECRRHGFWHHCAPVGAVAMHPRGLPVHGCAVAAPGAYAFEA